MLKQKGLLSIGEASEYLGVSIDTLRRWEKRGKIESLRSPGNHRYFSVESLDKLFGKKYQHDIKKTDKEKAFLKNKITQIPAVPLERPPSDSSPTNKNFFLSEEKIIDRPVREVRIPQLRLLRVIQEKENIKEETKVFQDEIKRTQEIKGERISTSILTPENLPLNLPRKIIDDTRIASAGLNNEMKLSAKNTIKKNLFIYAVITITILIVIATIFFIIGASSRGLLSPIP